MAISGNEFVFKDITIFVEKTMDDIESFQLQSEKEHKDELIDNDVLFELDSKAIEEINDFISTKIGTYVKEIMNKLTELPLESQHTQTMFLIGDIVLKMVSDRIIEKSKNENPKIHEMVLTKKCTDSLSEIAHLNYKIDVLENEIKSLKLMLIESKD